MDKLQTAQEIADVLFETEAAIDAAMSRANHLLTRMIAGRAPMGLSPRAGEATQAKTVDAIAALSQARCAIMAAHAGLARLSVEVGLGHVAYGPEDKPEETTPLLRQSVLAAA